MLMQHGEHGVFSGGKYGLGRLPLGSHLGSAEVGDRVRRIITEGRLSVHDQQWCREALSDRGRRPRQRLGMRTQTFGSRYLDREATYTFRLCN